MANYNGGRSMTGWIVGLVVAFVVIIGLFAFLGDDTDDQTAMQEQNTEQSPPAGQTPPAEQAPSTQSPPPAGGGSGTAQ